LTAKSCNLAMMPGLITVEWLVASKQIIQAICEL
jgi:hypothetical protein